MFSKKKKPNISEHFNHYDKSNIKLDKPLNNNIIDLNSLITELNLYKNRTKKTNFIFVDYFISKTCYDKNSFTISILS